MNRTTEGEYDYRVKIILLGDVSVGKSTFVRTLSKQDDIEHGCSCVTYKQNGYVEVECVRNGKKVLAKIIDTGGQEKFRSITASYYRGVHGCLFLFSKNKENTFDNIVSWVDELECFCPNDIVCTMLVGTTSSAYEQQICSEKAQKLGENINAPYAEVINSNSGQVVKILHNMIDQIVANSPKINSLTVSLPPPKQKKKKCMC
ncbi:hypothetical protein SNE40_003890 [Patella caerulea]|uniref:Uncharacterized protein n=1 Tax=Patella caerulea TaxID=87958 RepID=A0AAN8K8U0_PATCE